MSTSRRSDIRCTQLYSEPTLSSVIAATRGRCRQQNVGRLLGQPREFVVMRGGVGREESVPADEAECAVLTPLGRAPTPHLSALVVRREECPQEGPLDLVAGRPGDERVIDAGVVGVLGGA
jgi:hypothetical protein